jgi:hypothetical protein
MWRVLKPAIAAALAAALCANAGQAGEPGCVEWSRAGPIIAENGPCRPMSFFRRWRAGGKIVSQALQFRRASCSSPVAGPTGEVTNVTVDARTGQF